MRSYSANRDVLVWEREEWGMKDEEMFDRCLQILGRVDFALFCRTGKKSLVGTKNNRVNFSLLGIPSYSVA